jgi:hypothetical protein
MTIDVNADVRGTRQRHVCGLLLMVGAALAMAGCAANREPLFGAPGLGTCYINADGKEVCQDANDS